ncbi:hypothetical protein Glove_743g8 [Diversispora epigaea]|uniref:Uncharacterized protein n=1 Tax=Diversispora epigaea TaxID=1348612 RepID=A0A397G026_9GLOM|nr:hypothetical protein Glove_743g8 [Diversispora epigaea]
MKQNAEDHESVLKNLDMAFTTERTLEHNEYINEVGQQRRNLLKERTEEQEEAKTEYFPSNGNSTDSSDSNHNNKKASDLGDRTTKWQKLDPISVSGNNDHSDQPTRESSINLDFSFGSIENENYDIGLGSYEEGTEINPDYTCQTDEDLTVPVSEQPSREDIWGQWKLGSGKIIIDFLVKSANKKGHPLRPEVWGINENYDIGLGSYEEGTEINPDYTCQTDEDLTVPVSEQPSREDIWGQWKLGSGKIIIDFLVKSANKKGHPLRFTRRSTISNCPETISKLLKLKTLKSLKEEIEKVQLLINEINNENSRKFLLQELKINYTIYRDVFPDDSAIQQQNISESDYGGYIIHPSLKCMLSADGIFVIRLKKSFVEVGHLEMSGGHGHRDFSRSTWDGCCKLPIGNAYILEEIGERFRGASCETFSKIKNRIELWRMHVLSRGILQYERTHRATVPICFEDEQKCIFDFCWLLKVTNVIYKLREKHNDSDVNVSNLSSGILPLRPFILQKDKHKKGITTTYAKSESNSSFIRSG